MTQASLTLPAVLPRAPVLAGATLLLAAVVSLEWASALEFSLGVLYVFPVVVAAAVLTRFEVVLAAALCALIRSRFTQGLQPIDFWLRFLMATMAYGGLGLLIVEMSRNRRVISAAYGRLQLEQSMRHEAEEQLRTLADSSPAAIVVLNSRAEVLMANRSAKALFGYSPAESLVAVSLGDKVPVFAGALRPREGGQPMRASTTGWAKRQDGQPFPIATWFSTYGTGDDRRLAGILVDTSEELRDRDRETFRHTYKSNRLFASAVSHEIRNLSSAIRVVSSNLKRHCTPAADRDLTALSALVESLTRIASFDLARRDDGRANPPRVPVSGVLEQLRLVIEPDWNDVEGKVRWEMPATLPLVRGEEYALLQIFLNLAQNSLRAVQKGTERSLVVIAVEERGVVRVSFIDSGPGVLNPARLFQPFHEGAEGSGLGLFISRNLARSIGGDLEWVPTERGCRFDVTVLVQ